MSDQPLILDPPARNAEQWVVVVSADALFTAEGIAPVTLDRIAESAGLSRSTLDAAFASKESLVVAALQYRHQDWTEGLRRFVTGFEDPRDRVLAVFSYLETCFTERGYHGCSFINSYGELGRKDPTVAALAEEHLAALEGFIADLCTDAELPSYLADAMTLLIEGAQVEAAIHGTTQPARSARTAAAMLMSVYDRPVGA
jgi:AcrR family transcriptional regulator